MVRLIFIYEKILATGEVKCIDDEIPFDIPQGWEWCRMGAIGDWGAGATPNKGMPQYYGGNVLWLRTGELNESYIYDTEIKLTPLALKDCSLRLNQKGDVLIAMYGATIGKVAVAGTELTTNQACCACTPILVYNEYLFYFLMGSKDVLTKKGEGGAQPNISREKLISHLMPIPPLNEQFKIVNCIKRLIPTIKSYENLNLNLQNLNNSIKDILKKSILQEAIQGRLVTQIESDGTAEELLDEIRAEKQRLVKEGKLKKSALTNESRIFKGEDNKYYEQIGPQILDISDEIPFNIPDSWLWCRVSSIFQINPKNDADGESEAAFVPMELITPGIGSEFTYQIVKWKDIKRGYMHFANGDIAFAKITPCFQNRKSAIFKNLPNGIGAGTTELKVLRPLTTKISPKYVLAFLQSPYFIDEATFKGTANQQRIISGYLENKIFPLPPSDEQQRIVNRLEKISNHL